MGWTIGVLGFNSRRGLGIFLFTTLSRTALQPIQLPIQWVTGGRFLQIKTTETRWWRLDLIKCRD